MRRECGVCHKHLSGDPKSSEVSSGFCPPCYHETTCEAGDCSCREVLAAEVDRLNSIIDRGREKYEGLQEVCRGLRDSNEEFEEMNDEKADQIRALLKVLRGLPCMAGRSPAPVEPALSEGDYN